MPSQVVLKANAVFSTGIYFLLESHHISALHRIQSDEMWHFYAGCHLDVFMIDIAGNLDVFRLGNNPRNGEVFKLLYPKPYGLVQNLSF